MVASLSLVLQHLGALELPGCGVQSPCGRVTAGPWGTVPGLQVSTAALGLAYFAGVLTAWLLGRGRCPALARPALLVGALVSAMFIGIMLGEKSVCRYCLAAHGGHFVFLACALVTPGPVGTGSRRPLMQGAAAFFVVFTALFVVESTFVSGVQARRETALSESLEQIRKAAPADTSPTRVATPAKEAPVPPPEAKPAQTSGGFEGRYRLGPQRAAVRVVMFTDYQCSDCKIMEAQVQRIRKLGLDLAISIKYFPLSTLCNKQIPTDLHPNACWAARAAEAVGRLGGTDAFWRMHEWLFEKGGRFETNEELREGAVRAGVDLTALQRLMTDAGVESAIQEDIAEGMSYGIRNTPMIFINGVELKGWLAQDALVRAVQAAASAAPPAAGPEADKPLAASERFIEQWQESRVLTIPPDLLRRALGPEDAPVRVVVIGDAGEPGTAEADGILRLYTSGPGPNIRYTFVHFPVNQACNPKVSLTKFEASCLAARAAEAADAIAGEEAFWKMHDWLLSHREFVNEAEVLASAPALELGPSALRDGMAQPFIDERIKLDAALAASLGLTAVPMVIINGRHAENWKAQNENLLPRMIEAAAGEAGWQRPAGP